MALELLSYFQKSVAELTLIPSEGGRFEVSLNGDLIFSKLATERFPEPKELKQIIEARTGREEG